MDGGYLVRWIKFEVETEDSAGQPKNGNNLLARNTLRLLDRYYLGRTANGRLIGFWQSARPSPSIIVMRSHKAKKEGKRFGQDTFSNTLLNHRMKQN